MLKLIRPLYGTALLVACLVSGARAENMTLLDAGANAAMGGVYTSPYTVVVGNTPTLLICDDFTTDVSLGQNWTASVTTLTTIDSSTITGLKFSGGDPNAAAQNYVTAAVLAAQLMSLPNIGTPAEDANQAGILSFALWGVFDAPLLQSIGNNPYGTLTQAQFDAANTALATARGIASGITDLSKISVNGNSIAALTVYTPIGPNGLASSQEFLRVSMPEPSFPAVLAVDLLAVVGLIVVLRRRSAATLS